VSAAQTLTLWQGAGRAAFLTDLRLCNVQIVICAETEALTAVAWVRPADSGGQDQACLRELHVCLSLLLPNIGKDPADARLQASLTNSKGHNVAQ
jgi:hypothetical protein